MTLRSLSGVLVTALVLAAASPALAATSTASPLSRPRAAPPSRPAVPDLQDARQGPGQVWVHVCKSNKKNADGVICSEESIGRAKKKGSAFQYKPKFFDFDEFWLNSPGTYYWQAHRISCENGIDDCLQEGPIVKFKVG